MDLYELYKEISDRNPDKGKTHFEYINQIKFHVIRYYVPEWFSGIPSDWIPFRRLKSILRDLDLTEQIYYDLVIMGLSSPGDRPKCSNTDCNNQSKFLGIKSGYGLVCSKKCHIQILAENQRGRKQSEEVVHKRIERMKLTKNLPENKLKYSITQKEVQNRPEQKERIRKTKSLPEVAARISASQREAQNRPEVREKKSKALLGRKLPEEQKSKISDSMKKYRAENPESVNSWKTARHIIGIHKSVRFNKDIEYESSYERDFLNIIEESESVVEIITPVPRIRYYSPKKFRDRWYIPDFFLKLSDGSLVIVEIKPKNFLDDKEVIAKRDSALKYCTETGFRYITLTQEDIYIDKLPNKNLDLYEIIESNQFSD